MTPRSALLAERRPSLCGRRWTQAAVLTSRFFTYDSHLVIGGTYSGQMLVWDMRAKSLPVDKSALSFEGHTHPVYQVEIIGTQNAHNAFSVSTDGLACVWALDRLAMPEVRRHGRRRNHRRPS